MAGYVLYQGDCIDVMRGMSEGTADCVIADPPYMIGTKSDGHGKLDPWADYMNASYWYAELLRSIRGVMSPTGCAWVFMNWRGLATLTRAACDAGWPIGSVLTWHKDWPGTGNLLRSSSELVCLFAGEWFEMTRRDIQDVQTFKPVPTSQRVHPAQKPVELLRFLMNVTCPAGGGRHGSVRRVRRNRHRMRGDRQVVRGHRNEREMARTGRREAGRGVRQGVTAWDCSTTSTSTSAA